MGGEYDIRGPASSSTDRSVHIDVNDEFTPAEAMEFALAIIRLVQPDVEFTSKNWSHVGAAD